MRNQTPNSVRYILLLVLLAISACDSVSEFEPEAAVSPNPIDFSKLESGQHSVYVGFIGEDYRDPSNLAFEYKKDTLVVKVGPAVENGFVFVETIAPGSESLMDDDRFYSDSARYVVSIDQKATYRFEVSKTNIMHIKSMFMSYGEVLPALIQPFRENKVEIQGLENVIDCWRSLCDRVS